VCGLVELGQRDGVDACALAEPSNDWVGVPDWSDLSTEPLRGWQRAGGRSVNRRDKKTAIFSKRSGARGAFMCNEYWEKILELFIFVFFK
jgi:hypothetical protein